MAGIFQKKIMLLLLAGVSLGLSGNPMHHIRVVKELSGEWKKLSRSQLQRTAERLVEDGEIRIIKNKKNNYGLALTEKGLKSASEYNLDNVVIKSRKWNQEWYVVLFDIPNTKNKVRESLRYQLKRLGFQKYQASAFVYPFPCIKEINFIADHYFCRKFIRIIVAKEIDGEKELISHFKLNQ